MCHFQHICHHAFHSSPYPTSERCSGTFRSPCINVKDSLPWTGFQTCGFKKPWPSAPTQHGEGDWKVDLKSHIRWALVALLNHYTCDIRRDSLVCQHESSCKTLTQFPNNRRRVILILLYSFLWPMSPLVRLLDHTHTHTHTHTHRVGLLWTSDQLVAEAATYTTHTTHKRRTAMPSAGFERGIPATKRLQTHAADHAAIGTGPIRAQKLYFVSDNLAAHAYRSRTSASYYCSLVTPTETKLWLKVSRCVSQKKFSDGQNTEWKLLQNGPQ